MTDVPVERLMSTELVTIEPGATAADAAKRMLETGVSSILVVDGDRRLTGLITATDFVSLVRRNDPEDETPVEAFMTTDVVTTTAQESIRDVADAMIEHGFHHTPVVDEDEGVIGMITTSDLAGYISRVQSPSPAE